MNLFEVKVTAKDMVFNDSYVVFGTSKKHAMIKGIKIARLNYNVTGEVHAIAKVIREERFTPGINV